LTEHGIGQCRALSEELRTSGFLSDTSDILIVTSPLTRCLQTTLHAFDSIIAEKQPRIVALEWVRETVNFSCDRRNFASQLSKTFPMVDFGHILKSDDPDPIWAHYEQRLGDQLAYTKHRESAELYKVAERGRKFFEWLRLQPQSHVIVCTHSAFLRCILNYGYGVPSKPEQLLDDRDERSEDGPLLQYHCPELESSLRASYDKCEMRSMTAAFK
jgi:broad specificity phosphatase PhoE